MNQEHKYLTIIIQTSSINTLCTLIAVKSETKISIINRISTKMSIDFNKVSFSGRNDSQKGKNNAV